MDALPRGARRIVEWPLSNGFIPCYACGPIGDEWYVNEKMEEELASFKKEVARRFAKSSINGWTFPRKEETVEKFTQKQIEEMYRKLKRQSPSVWKAQQVKQNSLHLVNTKHTKTMTMNMKNPQYLTQMNSELGVEGIAKYSTTQDSQS